MTGGGAWLIVPFLLPLAAGALLLSSSASRRARSSSRASPPRWRCSRSRCGC